MIVLYVDNHPSSSLLHKFVLLTIQLILIPTVPHWVISNHPPLGDRGGEDTTSIAEIVNNVAEVSDSVTIGSDE